MFVVLQVGERKNSGVFSGIFNLLARPKIYVEARECLGTRFALIKAECPGDRLNWNAVENICGAYACKVLLPNGINPPEGSRIRSPALPMFNARVLTRTACEIIELSRMPMYRRVLGIIDMDALYTDIMYELLMHFTSVRVVTGEPEKYLAESERLMRELGAPVIVSDEFDCLAECVLVLAPSSVYTSKDTKIPCPVIAGGRFVSTQKINLITSLKISPGSRLAETCPPGIELHEFAGAAYEFCTAGMTENAICGRLPRGMSGQDLGDFIAERMIFNNRTAGIADIVRCVIECTGSV